MTRVPPSGSTKVIHAAGGLVWRGGRDAPVVALVRRSRYGDEWSLPKGKLNAGETWEKAAIREVREETGWAIEIAEFADGLVYVVDGRPKVVLYWHMEGVESVAKPDPKEILEVRWVEPGEALTMLRHRSEKQLLAAALDA